MEIQEDRWLADLFGHPVFRLGGEPDPERCLDHARNCEAAFYYARVDPARIDHVRALESAGLRVVDTAITLALRPPWPELAPEPSVSQARSDEEAAVVGLAGRAFRFSRFHLDPAVPRALADRIKREWTANYFRRARGERIYVARDRAGPAGFLAVRASSAAGGTVRTIDLLAVEPDGQGRGVGSALVRHFIQLEGPLSVRLEVGTQAANTPSLRLYERAGFLITETQFVMHGHIRAGRPLA